MGIVRLQRRPAAAPASRLAAALAALLTATALAFAPPARADVGETIIQRCTHGQSLSGFSQKAYGRALQELSADAEEYTDCSSLIRQAQQAAAGGSQGAGAAQSAIAAVPTTTSPAEQKALAQAASSKPGAVRLGGQVIHPGVVHASIASAFSSLPTPLLATLLFLLACLGLVVGGAVRKRFRGRRAD